MMKFVTIEGQTLYVDPLAVLVVAPAYGGPPPGMSPAEQRLFIPKMIGAQLLMQGMNLAVQGEPADVAHQIEHAKGAARRPTLHS